MPIELRTASESDRSGWIEALKEAKKKPAVDAPQKAAIERGKNSKRFRAKKKMSGKVATSGAGKKAIRKALNEETVPALSEPLGCPH